MRATYKCTVCGARFILCDGACYCPTCGGHLKVILSPVGRAKRTFRMACAAMCGAWAVMLYNGIMGGAETMTLILYGAAFVVCVMGTGVIRVKRNAKTPKKGVGQNEKIH